MEARDVQVGEEADSFCACIVGLAYFQAPSNFLVPLIQVTILSAPSQPTVVMVSRALRNLG